MYLYMNICLTKWICVLLNEYEYRTMNMCIAKWIQCHVLLKEYMLFTISVIPSQLIHEVGFSSPILPSNGHHNQWTLYFLHLKTRNVVIPPNTLLISRIAREKSIQLRSIYMLLNGPAQWILNLKFHWFWFSSLGELKRN